MKSIKVKLLVIFSAVIFLLSLVLITLTVTVIRNDAVTEAKTNLYDLAYEKANHLSATVQGRLQYLSGIALNPMITDSSVELNKKMEFFNDKAQITGFSSFLFINKNGNIQNFSSDMEEDFLSSNIHVEAFSGKSSVSDLIITSDSQSMFFIYSVPVYDAGTIVGALLAKMDGVSLSDIISQVKYRTTGYAYVINNNGTTVAHKNQDLVLAKDNDIENMKTDASLKQLGELTMKIIKGGQGSGEYVYKGVTKLVGYAPVPDTSFIVIFGMERAEALATSNALGNTLIIIAAIVFAVSTVIVYIVSHSIAKPIQEITKAAQGIAKGELDISMELKSKDEIGRLAVAFGQTISRLKNYMGYISEISHSLQLISDGELNIDLKMEYVGQFSRIKESLENLISKLNVTMKQISKSADLVTVGAEQLSHSSQTLSQGATEQASSVEQLSSNIEEITSQIQQNAVDAADAMEKAKFAGEQTLNSMNHMNDVMQAMEQINTKSSEISKIIKIIDDIAFQTNILALNAAVEAARAGEAGKGFAVVADEVRNLAAKSADAANNTTILIDDTLKAVHEGTDIASNASDALNETVRVAKNAIDLMENIAESSKAQAISIEKISNGVNKISSVVHENAATAEESSASSEELAAQAELMHELVQKFKVKN